ncbi:SelB domain-containing protein [Mesorhizobium sp. f-mel]
MRLPGHEVRLTPQDETLWLQIERLIGGSTRYHPPRVRDIADTLAKPETEIRRLLKLTGRIGKVYEVAHDHFFLRPALAGIVEIVDDLTAAEPGGRSNAAQFRDRAGSGRKIAIQILEFLDRQAWCHFATRRPAARQQASTGSVSLTGRY